MSKHMTWAAVDSNGHPCVFTGLIREDLFDFVDRPGVPHSCLQGHATVVIEWDEADSKTRGAKKHKLLTVRMSGGGPILIGNPDDQIDAFDRACHRLAAESFTFTVEVDGDGKPVKNRPVTAVSYVAFDFSSFTQSLVSWVFVSHDFYGKLNFYYREASGASRQLYVDDLKLSPEVCRGTNRTLTIGMVSFTVSKYQQGAERPEPGALDTVSESFILTPVAGRLFLGSPEGVSPSNRAAFEVEQLEITRVIERKGVGNQPAKARDSTIVPIMKLR